IGNFTKKELLKKVIVNKLENLKLIATRSTGFDHIDLQRCREKGIVICNVPYYGENTVAEHTFALILNLTRKIHKAWERTRRKVASGWRVRECAESIVWRTRKEQLESPNRQRLAQRTHRP
ncbi:MAG: hypothetical protein IH991_23105, partial [Planctomycetes bacterium]|nr:hypothetical protein [Planctomycetota bacterium]